jgi:hypothetical protein
VNYLLTNTLLVAILLVPHPKKYAVLPTPQASEACLTRLLTTAQVDDTATAILKKKKKPNSLTVTDSVNDDNSAYS